MNGQPPEQERWRQNDFANVSDEENNAAHDVQRRRDHDAAAAWHMNRNINIRNQSLDEESLPDLLDDAVIWVNPNDDWSDDTESLAEIENQAVQHQSDDEGMHSVGDDQLLSSDEDSVQRGESNELIQEQRHAWNLHIRERCRRRYGIVLTDEELESFEYDSEETVDYESRLPMSIHTMMQERARIAEARRRLQQMAILRTFR
eukprot:CAMPEP_0196809540 /NCGR_PEP_ID=MMETSP1362-20130617/9463_1 /TAXON_ID=163516 /ORGANISM="Leptocylindrus danicus, Strain CCMP1856" /LENGTH=202 /DNA_ID=CAMNT_0042184263 /DNA_START=197 /DNA_END=805 /DNA_ORIENTATION=-